AYAIAPILSAGSEATSNPVRPTPRMMSRLNTGIVVVLGVAIAALLPWWRPTDPALRAPAGVLVDAPPGLTGGLRTLLQPGARILTAQPWGSWLAWAFPDATVAVDSRIEVIPPAVWSDFERVGAGLPGWEEVVADWQPTVAVLGPDDIGLLGRLQ